MAVVILAGKTDPGPLRVVVEGWEPLKFGDVAWTARCDGWKAEHRETCARA